MYLHLLRDIDMYEFLDSHGVKFDGSVEYFNEILSEGALTEDVFGAEFCSCRSVFHQLPQEDYEEQAIEPIREFLELEYEELHLYFSSEYEDAINLIAIFAYLDRNAYEGAVILHVTDKDYNVIKDVAVNISGFYALYAEALVTGRMPQAEMPAEIARSIKKYMQNRQW